MAYYVARFSLFLGVVIYKFKGNGIMYQHPLRLLLLGSGPPGFFGRGMVLSPVRRKSTSVDIAWRQTRGGKGEMKLDGHEDPSIHDGCRFVSCGVVCVSVRVCKLVCTSFEGLLEHSPACPESPDESPTLEDFKDLTSIITMDSQW